MAQQTKQASKGMVVAVSAVGGGLEMYDFVMYVLFAPIIGQLFFPSSNHYISQMAIFATFATGYLARPVGGLLFGIYGDRRGRRKSLLYTLMGMALATMLIGCLPTYEQVGWLAPALLIILRIVQGIAVGGDLPGAITLVSEYAGKHERGLLCSLVFFGVNLGLLLASLFGSILTAAFSHDALVSYGWRLGFIFSIVLFVIGIFFRMKIRETPMFEVLHNLGRLSVTPVRTLVKEHGGSVAKAFVAMWLFVVIIIQVFLYMPSYLNQVAHISLEKATFYNTANLLLFTLLIPVMGWLSDRVGRKPLLLVASIFFLFASYPLYHVVSGGREVPTLLAMFCFGAFSSIVVGTLISTLSELFITRVRYSGIGLSYNLSFALIGGFSPLVATFLIHKTRDPAALALNVIIGALLLIVVALPGPQSVKEKKGKELE